MGNPKFRLSHMLPNAWFYKLLDHHGRHRYRHPRPPLPAGKTATKGAGLEITPNNSSNRLQHESYKGSQQRSLGAAEHSESGRKSYYFTRELNAAATTATTGDPPRKSTKKRHPHRRPTGNHHVSSISAVCTCRATASLHPCRPKPDSPPPELSSSTTGDCSAVDGSSLLLPTESFDRMLSLSTGDGGDIVIDVDKKSLAGKIETQMGLPPIITKPEKTTTQMEEKIKPKENSNGSDFLTTLMKKIDNNSQEQSIRRVKKSPGLKLRVNSPRIVSASGGRRSVSGGGGRRSGASESCLAVVKASYDPQKDFRESMVEMIVKNNIRGSKDLEDLLASYLLLNSDEYHDMIIKVFKQIWFDLSELKQSKLMDKI